MFHILLNQRLLIIKKKKTQMFMTAIQISDLPKRSTNQHKYTAKIIGACTQMLPQARNNQ